jgi:hypothetical protein
MTSISLIQKNRNSCSLEREGKLAAVLGRLSLVAILYEPGNDQRCMQRRERAANRLIFVYKLEISDVQILIRQS